MDNQIEKCNKPKVDIDMILPVVNRYVLPESSLLSWYPSLCLASVLKRWENISVYNSSVSHSPCSWYSSWLSDLPLFIPLVSPSHDCSVILLLFHWETERIEVPSPTVASCLSNTNRSFRWWTLAPRPRGYWASQIYPCSLVWPSQYTLDSDALRLCTAAPNLDKYHFRKSDTSTRKRYPAFWANLLSERCWTTAAARFWRSLRNLLEATYHRISIKVDLLLRWKS